MNYIKYSNIKNIYIINTKTNNKIKKKNQKYQ